MKASTSFKFQNLLLQDRFLVESKYRHNDNSSLYYKGVDLKKNQKVLIKINSELGES